MYVRKPFSPNTNYRNKREIHPAWHTTVEKSTFSFTKKVTSLCGKIYMVDGITEIENNIGSDRTCGVCENLKKGKKSTLRIWSSTGYSNK